MSKKITVTQDTISGIYSPERLLLSLAIDGVGQAIEALGGIDFEERYELRSKLFEVSSRLYEIHFAERDARKLESVG